MKHKRRVIMVTLWHLFAISTIIVSFIFVFTIAYWTIPNPTPFTFYTEKNLVLNKDKTVKAGENLLIEVEFTQNYTGQHVTVDRTIEDGSLITLPQSSYVTEKGYKKFQRVFEVPAYLPTGVYRMKFTNSVKINPMKTITVIRYSEDFKIIGKE